MMLRPTSSHSRYSSRHSSKSRAATSGSQYAFGRLPRTESALRRTSSGTNGYGFSHRYHACMARWVSAAEPRRQVLEALGDHVPLLLGLEIGRLPRAMLRRPRHERGAEAERARVAEVAVVGGHHQALRGLEVEHRGGREIGLRQGLVGPGDLGAQHGVPRQPCAPRHVHDERDVAVRQRRQDVLLPQAREAGHGVGPRIEPVPGAVQLVGLGLAEALDAELDDELVEAQAVQVIQLRPRDLIDPHLRHGRLVERAPAIGERRPVHAGDALALLERLAFADEAGPPVDHRAEHIERQGLDRIDHGDCPLPVGRQLRPHSRRDARRAPSARAPSLAHTMVGWISSEPAKVAKPQSLPAITRSRPTTLANLTMRSATSSGCSTSTLDCVMMPGIRILPSGSLTSSHTRHSCSWRGFAASREYAPAQTSRMMSTTSFSAMSCTRGPMLMP